MPAETTTDVPQITTGRRAADTTALKFREAELKSAAQFKKAFEEGEIEIINFDLVTPGGDVDDLQQPAPPSAPSSSALTREQIKARLHLAQFKQSFESFGLVSNLLLVTMADIKRGDVIAIKTIVGTIYLNVLDRIKGMVAGTGEALCECHYDLGDQCDLVHAASVQLPICTRTFTITNPDGVKRCANRQLKLVTDVTLPAHVAEILHERFFVGISIYANPQREKRRLVDLGRWLVRSFLRLKAIIKANNQYEREKRLKNKSNSAST